MNEAIIPLLTRRSTSVKDMAAPAPSAAELETILRVATRVPDHGKLCPWRIVVLRGEGALKLGAIAADIFAKQTPEATEAQIAAEHTRFTRAPLCLAVISTPKLGTKPVWEQELSAGAVCLNILHAAHALGYGGKWLTEWVAYDDAILAALLSVSPAIELHDGQARIAGFIYLGTKTTDTADRERPALKDVVGEFG
ncbi:MAG: nitroreductase [Rickettsiales bacterium]|nr:nitroreductase [Rickettsiales bacterium]